MLKTPRHGWTEVTIGNRRFNASYLVDIPFEWLESCIYALREKVPVVLCIDEEGKEDLVVVDMFSTYVIECMSLSECFEEKGFGIHKVAAELIDDIESDFDAWVEWDIDDFSKSPKKKEKRAEKLRKLIEKTKRYL